MADFNDAVIAKLLEKEDRQVLTSGVLNLHKVKGDTGGWTIGGVARRKNPAWPGWKIVDQGERRLSVLMPYLKAFYRRRYWEKVRAGDMPAPVAVPLFLLAVVAGVGRAALTLQIAVGAVPDRQVGPKTLVKVRTMIVGRIIERMGLCEVIFYRDLANRSRSRRKFLRGWINRSTSHIDLKQTISMRQPAWRMAVQNRKKQGG